MISNKKYVNYNVIDVMEIYNLGIDNVIHPVRLCWNLAYADAYADLLWEENTVRWLKSNSSE